MTKKINRRNSYWDSTLNNPVSYPPLTQDLDVDVVVVGAGIVGLTAAKHFVGDRFGIPAEDVDLAPGQATITRINDEKVAMYCDDAGTTHAVSAVCTHMGCLVGWNQTDRSWDCPCHGSRFDTDGKVLHGPATSPLEKVTEG